MDASVDLAGKTIWQKLIKRSDQFRKMKGNETNLLYDRPGVIPWSFRGIHPPNIG